MLRIRDLLQLHKITLTRPRAKPMCERVQAESYRRRVARPVRHKDIYPGRGTSSPAYHYSSTSTEKGRCEKISVNRNDSCVWPSRMASFSRVNRFCHVEGAPLGNFRVVSLQT